MYSPLSVCIPVYNEEKTIGQTICSVLAQSYPAPLEIMVGCNGCTDRTEEVARQYPVRILSIGQQGKPGAWNALRAEASHEYLVFMDGDVQVDSKAFRFLYDALAAEPSLAAVTASNVPFFQAGRTLLDRLAVAPSGEVGCLSGRLYMVKATALTEAMNALSFSTMPNDVINEDYWVTCVLGKGRWATVDDAVVFFTPPVWNDYCRVETRIFRGRIQMHREYGELLDRMGRPTRKELFSSRWRRLKGVEGYGAKALAILGFVARKAALHGIRPRVLSEQYTTSLAQKWLFAPSSKIPFTMPEQHHALLPSAEQER